MEMIPAEFRESTRPTARIAGNTSQIMFSGIAVLAFRSYLGVRSLPPQCRYFELETGGIMVFCLE